MSKVKKLAIGALSLPLALMGLAYAAEFSPTGSFSLSNKKVNGNPVLKIHLEQDQGEQEMGHVTLVIPAGFKLPKDRAIPNGDQIGSADIQIDTGPRCNGQGPISGPAMFPDRRITEKDRTDEQKDRNVKAVWVVDLQPVTTIPLEIKGNARRGWKAEGDIPANQFTCPPLTFDAEIFKRSAASDVKIIRNPGSPGRYVFKAIFETQESPATEVIRQTIRITR